MPFIFVPTASLLKRGSAHDLAERFGPRSRRLPDSAVRLDLVKPTPAKDKAAEKLARIALLTREDKQEIEYRERRGP